MLLIVYYWITTEFDFILFFLNLQEWQVIFVVVHIIISSQLYDFLQVETEDILKALPEVFFSQVKV